MKPCPARRNGSASAARPYVERALRDDEFRQNVKAAFTALREIYEHLAPPRGMADIASRVASDQEIQHNLRRALAELRHAAERLQAQRRRSYRVRNGLLLAGGLALVALFNPVTGPEARRWLRARLGRGKHMLEPSTNGGVTA
ncbi:MAG: hypothetical protein C4305_02895 [Thermoleophilia bacterium]